ncbi:hypothetical protein [Persicitalea jodogahamensis]|uniref:Uncharacterized protein n=1 Tax=Persicitalea jodogahamensis TaxID=402147 RepID=A0A8J3DCV2_9BACT|nr:hypothetical protein [Persicitalea jodogahamensis]GHB84958.1 hypothetical protein GCM10007390_45260 [Persicitalea jodogahamensis]
MPITKALTDEQIEALFSFVRSKYVDHYDVQVELVDHLASEIEQQMAESPDITFGEGLQRIYQRFGIFGFSELVEQKQKAADRRARVLWWQCVKYLLRLPFLIGSLIGGMLIYICFDFLEGDNFLLINASLALSAIVVNAISVYRNRPSRGYRLTSYQYNGILHFWNMFHFQAVFVIADWIMKTYPFEVYSILVPLLCWISWLGFAASILSFKRLAKEQRRLFPLAFA